ncbi:MAG: tetratricopeptide repeat protein [Fimbriimonadaceae bacterium]
MRISIIFVALLLIGCSGTDPAFIYNQTQADAKVKELTELATKPIQKYITNAELTDADKTSLATALPIIDQIIQYDPVTINSYNLKGKCLAALGRTVDAKAAYLDGISLSVPRDDDTSKLIRSDTYTELAKIHVQENDFKSAELAAKNAIATQDTDPAPHVILGRIYAQQKKKQLAQDEALRALLINADYEPARNLFRDLNPSLKASP